MSRFLEQVDKNKLVKLLFRILFICMMFFLGKKYYNYSEVIQKKHPIKYVVIDSKVNKGIRGDQYSVTVSYDNKYYIVDISRQTYDDIKRGELPSLYYSDIEDDVFSISVMKFRLRALFLFLFLFLCTFISIPKKWGNVPIIT